ncbi:MAG: single-stranded DNA-binding protein [Alphaproteobacteria bacterium CG1_02_46_17]|nr:MAG: single-stranded DNA-binding protein [Alphaproteobacteria bacterium CG1_02_46_17]
MAGSLNKVMLIGNLGNEPEIRNMTSGDEVASFSVATSESWKDKASGERKERTQWHKVVIFNSALVNVTRNYLHKGSKVFIEGQLETRKWTDKDGRDQYTTEVVLRPYRGELTMLDSKGSSSASNDSYGESASSGGSYSSGPSYGGSAAASPVDELADDIPF